MKLEVKPEQRGRSEVGGPPEATAGGGPGPVGGEESCGRGRGGV